MKLLQIDFPHNGPYGKDLAIAMTELAESIANEPGCLWKIWTENEITREAGGIYLFSDEETLNNYVEMHTKRLVNYGISNINLKIFDVNEHLSAITHAVLTH